MANYQFECLKCGGRQFDMGEIRAAGGFWTKMLDIQSEKYKALSCRGCGYTEFYKADSSMLENILDFAAGK